MDKYLDNYWLYVLLSGACVIAINLFVLHNKPQDSPAPMDGHCAVQDVIDGDSLRVLCQGFLYELRLMHIDAPEYSQEHWGRKSRLALLSLVGERVYVTFHGADIYQRNLALVYDREGGVSLNRAMLERGMARTYRIYEPPRDFVQSMRRAKKDALGIWRAPGLHQDPQRYRRLSQH